MEGCVPNIKVCTFMLVLGSKVPAHIGSKELVLGAIVSPVRSAFVPTRFRLTPFPISVVFELINSVSSPDITNKCRPSRGYVMQIG
jgi:hypothetical protein